MSSLRALAFLIHVSMKRPPLWRLPLLPPESVKASSQKETETASCSWREASSAEACTEC